MLAAENDDYEADAQALLSMLAVQSAIDAESKNGDTAHRPRLVIEVSKQSTAKLLESLGGPHVTTVENMTNRVLAQCARQNGLAKVYRKLMRHTASVINVRHFPELQGLPYKARRQEYGVV